MATGLLFMVKTIGPISPHLIHKHYLKLMHCKTLWHYDISFLMLVQYIFRHKNQRFQTQPRILPLTCLSVLLLLDDLGVPPSTCTKLGMEVATLDGRGFRGDDRSLIFTGDCPVVPRFTLLLCLVGGALDAIKERPNLFSGMVFRAGILNEGYCWLCSG